MLKIISGQLISLCQVVVDVNNYNVLWLAWQHCFIVKGEFVKSHHLSNILQNIILYYIFLSLSILV